MIRPAAYLLPLAALLAVSTAADAARLRLGFQGGAWQFNQADQVEAWSNSPQSAIAIDNRQHSGFTTVSVTWQNLIAGSFLASPEGVVLGSSREGQAMTSQLTVPPGERQQWALHPNVNGPYRFAVIGDTRNPDRGSRIFGEAAKGMASDRVTFAVHVGNAVSGGNRSQMAMFRSQLKSFSFPTYVVPGNHDLTAGGREPWSRLFGEMPVSFQIDQDHFILLDNAFGTLNASQMAWLERTLTKAREEKARHLFVFMHRPPVDPRPGINRAMTDVRQVRALLGLFQRHRVHTVFAGHIPMYAQERRQAVDYVTTGGGGEKLAVPQARGGFHHYMRVRVEGETVTIEPVKL